MKKYLNIFLWIMFFSLMAPSGMALASWNAVPGDSTYSWKIALEKGLLAILPSDQLKSTTHSKLTERRLGEVSRVLSGVHASESLDNLSAQILTTKEALNKIDNAVDRQTAVTLYIQTLNEVSNQLEQEKETRALAYLPPQNTNPNNNYNINQLNRTNRYSRTTTRRTYTPPTTNTQIPTTNIQQPEVNEPINPPIVPVPPIPNEEDVIDEEIVEEIGETQEEIENIIEELEDIIEEAEEQVEQEQQQQQDETPQQDEEEDDDDKGKHGKGKNSDDDKGKGKRKSDDDRDDDND